MLLLETLPFMCIDCDGDACATSDGNDIEIASLYKAPYPHCRRKKKLGILSSFFLACSANQLKKLWGHRASWVKHFFPLIFSILIVNMMIWNHVGSPFVFFFSL